MLRSLLGNSSDYFVPYGIGNYSDVMSHYTWKASKKVPPPTNEAEKKEMMEAQKEWEELYDVLTFGLWRHADEWLSVLPFYTPYRESELRWPIRALIRSAPVFLDFTKGNDKIGSYFNSSLLREGSEGFSFIGLLFMRVLVLIRLGNCFLSVIVFGGL